MASSNRRSLPDWMGVKGNESTSCGSVEKTDDGDTEKSKKNSAKEQNSGSAKNPPSSFTYMMNPAELESAAKRALSSTKTKP